MTTGAAWDLAERARVGNIGAWRIDTSSGLFGAADQLLTDAFLAAADTEDFSGLDPWSCFNHENSLVHTSVPRLGDVPGLVILAENDDRISTVVERAAFDALCTQGFVLEYAECAGASHIEAFLYSVDNAFAFIDARLAGDPLDAPCVQRPPAPCLSDPR